MLPSTACQRLGTRCAEAKGAAGNVAMVAGAPGWEERAALGNRGLQVLRELLGLLPNWDAIHADVTAFMEAAHTATEAIMSALPVGVQLTASRPAQSVVMPDMMSKRMPLQPAVESLPGGMGV